MGFGNRLNVKIEYCDKSEKKQIQICKLYNNEIMEYVLF